MDEISLPVSQSPITACKDVSDRYTFFRQRGEFGTKEPRIIFRLFTSVSNAGVVVFNHLFRYPHHEAVGSVLGSSERLFG